MGLFRTISEINGNFSGKSHFSLPCIQRPAEGFVTGYWRVSGQNLESLRCRAEKEVRRYLQPSGYNKRK